MSGSQLKFVLLEISKQLSDENLENLKFLVPIGKQKLEKIKTGHQLFEALSERGQLADDKTDFLSNLLRQIKRNDLAEMLNNLETQSEDPGNGISDTERAKLSVATEVIGQHLGRNWRKLGRKLGLSEVKLDSIATRHPTDLEETAMELLKEWKKMRRAEARAEQLIAALRNCGLNLTADKIEERAEFKENTKDSL